MSLNQSKNNEPSSQYRRTGRSGNSAQNRNYTGGGGGGGKGGGGGGGSSAAPSSLPSSRSFKKINNNNNTQGGQPRVNSSYGANANSSDSSSRGVQNGAHLQQPPLPGTSDVPVTGVTAKSADVSTQRPSPGVPKVPAANSVPSSDTSAYATPTKAPSDASRSFPLQFGSISPGFMNGMQIPARTNSAPPNLDEQKRDQARHDTIKATSTAAAPAIPKHNLPKKDAGAVEQTSIGEAHQIPKAKREVQVSPAPPVPQPQKPSVHPIPGVSMQVPYHQSPPIHVQFGGPNPQMQSQGMANTSLPMPIPMPLSMANPTQVPQQVFVSGIQHHPMQSQGIIPQGLNFSSQMGPQMPPHLGNMGINIPPQYQQPQASKFGGPRKTVKITHPETHEELRLDGSLSGARSHQHVQPQSQAIPSFQPAHPMNYYSNSYNGGPLYFPAATSNPLTGSQIAPGSQATRFYNQGGQVTVKPAVGLHGEKVGDSSLSISSPAVDKSEPSKIPRSRGEPVSLLPQRDSDTISESSLQQSNSTSMTTASKPAAAAFGSFPAENLHANSSASSLPVEASLGNNVTEVARKEVVSRSSSFKDEQKKSGKKGHSVMEVEVTGPSVSISSALPQSMGTTNNSADGGVLENTLRPSQMILSSGSDESTLDTLRKPLPNLPDSSVSKTDGSEEGQKSLEMAGAGPDIKVERRVPESADLKEQGEMEAAKDGDKNLEIPAGSSSKSSSDVNQDEERPVPNFVATSDAAETVNAAQLSIQEPRSWENAQLAGNEIVSLETACVKVEESVDCRNDDDNTCSLVTSTSTSELDALNAEISSLTMGSSTILHADKISTSDSSLSRSNSRDARDVPVRESGTLEEGPTVCVSDANSQPEAEGTINNSTELISPSASSSKDKPSVEMSKAKGTTAKAKKKRKEILKNADALGTTSDLYMAYKGPEEKKESLPSADDTESSSSITTKQTSVDVSDRDISSEDQSGHRKPEPDDWEDAADMSTPKLETSDDGKGAHAGLRGQSEDGNEGMTKKYSRDFLLKFSEQCVDLPMGFEITSDIAEALIASNNNSRESYPSPGRNVDRQTAGSRAERRAVGVVEDDKWSRLPGPLGPGRDLRLDIGYGANLAGFRPVQGGNYGVLRNPRAQAPMQYIGVGGILSGPMQSPGPQGGMQRHSSDSDRWQRSPAYQKGLIPSPQTPLQVMHKAERKYEVGKITDEEQAKQRQLKGILNKLTPQNFEKLFDQVKQVNIDNAGTLSGVIAQIFDKALMEPTFCEMYANFCYHLSRELPDFSEDDEKITFKRLLLNKCQEEFERGEREQEEANRAEEEGEVKQTEEEREEKRIKARRRMLGNIRLIGELYKKKMLTERIMHECIKKLLGQYQNPDEEDVEALCKLMSTIGEMIDHPKAKEHMDAYFDMMAKLSNNMKLSSRVRFMLKDSIDLRKNKWQQRRKVEGPKKIEEVHRDAAQERQAQSSRLARGSSMNASVRRGQPMDFVPRGSNPLPSPNAQMGSFRGFPQQLRGYGNQDVRFEERHAFENRTLSVPLRPLGDESITLGPQGGLARGMSIRGQPSLQSIPIADIPSPADSRRLAAGPNGFSSVSERTPYGSREDLMPRYMTERFAAPTAYDQSNIPERNMNFPTRDMRSTDRNFDRAPPASPPERGRGPALTPNSSSDKVLPEERLRSMSMEAIKEFYSAKDEKEVALCIKDLNAPSFYPSMISIWVTDSFERKDMERELLAKLLINLTRSQDVMLSQEQLVKGFESVLATLEDAVNDAPKAAEFLGRIFASILMEKAMPYTEAWRLIYEGGEEVGRLVEIGLAAEVMGVILEIIQSEKGEPFLKEIRTGSNLHIEKFRPPNSKKSLRIDKFV